ncbi:MAG: Coenzyme F420 hydrogenase/dehydrogenase, beta subunit C-terminal domain [Clostridia bacterium]|nr:Coenzyme F420 hydrogenase/dehydrogenase, beta subunit C-terminal domain [Clostridia bacterium]
MIDQVPSALCSGCRACEAVCPHKAIDFVEGEDRFLYPQAGKGCVSCGLCLAVCPVMNETVRVDRESIQLTAAQNHNAAILEKSSSGGVFFELARMVVEGGGVVFGAAWDKDFRLKHQAVSDVSALSALMGSKYVQSDTAGCYPHVKSVLDDGRDVLFSGTPCQVRGLLAFLRKDYANLYTVDVVCHGVPSQDSFDRYIAACRKKVGSALTKIDFRSKSSGWRNFSVRLEFENGTVMENTVRDDLFMRAFLKNLTLRRSCYQCRANDYRSGSDITLGDFWNIEKIGNGYSDDRGVSGVMLKTEKGKRLFSRLYSNFILETHPLSDFVKYNVVVETSVKQPEKRETYLRLLASKSFERLDGRFVCSSRKEALKRRIKKIIRR